MSNKGPIQETQDEIQCVGEDEKVAELNTKFNGSESAKGEAIQQSNPELPANPKDITENPLLQLCECCWQCAKSTVNALCCCCLGRKSRRTGSTTVAASTEAHDAGLTTIGSASPDAGVGSHIPWGDIQRTTTFTVEVEQQSTIVDTQMTATGITEGCPGA